MRKALSVFFAVYFLLWLLGGAEVHATGVIPEWLLFFTRSACLFPHEAPVSIDYYAQGWDCARKEWVEIDPSPYFPIIVSGRESRFDRTMRLFYANHRVMRAMRRFLFERWNEDHPEQLIGDVRLLDIRVPIPAPGDPIERYVHRALRTVPRRWIKLWSRESPLEVREVRCQALANRKVDDTDGTTTDGDP